MTVIPGAPAPEKPATEKPAPPAKATAPAAKPATGRTAGKSTPTTASGSARYGEAVVREILGANFLEEQSLAPRDAPATLGGDIGAEPRPEA